LCTLPNNAGKVQDLPTTATPRILKVALAGAQQSGRTDLRQALLETMAHQANPATLELTIVQESDSLGHTFDAILLMGLDLPSAQPNAWQDLAWRFRLQQANLHFQVIYGLGPARLKNAWVALSHLLPEVRALSSVEATVAPPVPDSQQAPVRWQWRCEKCSDADCEHRLFTALQREKQNAAK
jgi:hypothetical protein